MIDIKVKDIKSVSSVVRQVYPEMDSVQYVPAIYGYVSQGTFYCRTPGLTVRSLNEGAIITPYSDIVQMGRNCIYEKMFRPTSGKNIFSDENLIHANREAFELKIKPPDIVGSIPEGYSMLGAPSSHWGHFISEYFPSLLATLPTLSDDVVIIIPPDYDEIQIEFLKFALSFCNRKNKFYFCPRHRSVLVEKLYTSDKSSFLTDHSNWVSMYDFIVQGFCSSELSKFTGLLAKSPSDVNYEKIFLTRRAAYRRVLNIDQVEEFFRARGYAIIDPGVLSHLERIKVFSGCRELAGIYSSAFFNLIYCPNIERVKMIAPFTRCIDQIIINLFRPAQLTYFIVECIDQGAHPDFIISEQLCKNVAEHR